MPPMKFSLPDASSFANHSSSLRIPASDQLQSLGSHSCMLLLLIVIFVGVGGQPLLGRGHQLLPGIGQVDVLEEAISPHEDPATTTPNLVLNLDSFATEESFEGSIGATVQLQARVVANLQCCLNCSMTLMTCCICFSTIHSLISLMLALHVSARKTFAPLTHSKSRTFNQET